MISTWHGSNRGDVPATPEVNQNLPLKAKPKPSASLPLVGVQEVGHIETVNAACPNW